MSILPKRIPLTVVWARDPAAGAPDKRELLLRYGVRVFHRQGVNGTGLAELLELAGMGKGQFYYYFESKDHFVCEVVHFAMNFFLTRVAPHTVELRSLEDFDEWYQPYLDFAHLPDSLGCPVGSIGLELSSSSPPVQDAVACEMARWIEALARGLTVFKERHQLAEDFQAQSLAEGIAAEIQGALLLGRALQTSRYIVAARERTRRLLRSFLP